MKITPKKLRVVLNLWFPFLFSGIKVLEIKSDWSYAKVRLRRRWYNQNAVGTHFGGSLFAMTDPFCMLLTLYRIKKTHIVWDKKAEIKFIKATKKVVFAEFHIPESMLQGWLEQLKTQDKIEPQLEVDIKDGDGILIAKVWKTLYIANKNTQKS
ncbi:DUF4442 domain-containing protein [Kangiella sp. TOML190]|uniref:DUF4442 domain-containing protein n=1 Tax=Kangiella sp. TOML190 TaxID=2931351 RepID=UPI00203CCFB8|nr:DUF4442 domain-containing protein [Kangiella sp. TOML190]